VPERLRRRGRGGSGEEQCEDRLHGGVPVSEPGIVHVSGFDSGNAFKIEAAELLVVTGHGWVRASPD